jgi:hypothetical protein
MIFLCGGERVPVTPPAFSGSDHVPARSPERRFQNQLTSLPTPELEALGNMRADPDSDFSVLHPSCSRLGSNPFGDS